MSGQPDSGRLRNLLEQAKESLALVGDGDWTPQDSLLRQIASEFPRLLDIEEAARIVVIGRSDVDEDIVALRAALDANKEAK